MQAASMPINAGTNVQKLNTATLAAGLYIITIQTKEGFATHKLIIQE